MIKLPDVIQIVLGQMAQFSDSGNMLRKGAEFFDTPTEIVIQYNITGVPYIIYQEEGFIHYLTGKKVTKNQYFISKKTVGQLSMLGYSDVLGIEYNMLENDQTLLEDRNKMLEEIGATQRI